MTVPRALDWTRPYGIPFDRPTCPPDDEVTDVAAWLAGRWDGLHATEFCLRGGADRLADLTNPPVRSATTDGEP